jgi:hypothetical protein
MTPAEAALLLAEKSSRPDAGVYAPDGAWLTEQAEALYSAAAQGPDAQVCPVCLRAFDAAKAEAPGDTRPHGGHARIFCGIPCRERDADHRRRAIPTRWARCRVCSTGYLRLSSGPMGRVVCPPPTPASYWAESPCLGEHRRLRNAEARARAEAAGRLAVVSAWLIQVKGWRPEDAVFALECEAAQHQCGLPVAAPIVARAWAQDALVRGWRAHLAGCRDSAGRLRATCPVEKYRLPHRWAVALDFLFERGLPPWHPDATLPAPRTAEQRAAEEEARKAERAARLARKSEAAARAARRVRDRAHRETMR